MSDFAYDVEWDEKAQNWLPATGRPGASTASWDGEQWVRTGKNPEGPGALARGLVTGYEQAKGLVFDAAPALVYSKLGYDDDAVRKLQDFKQRMDDLEARGLKSRVGLDDINSLKSAGEFALESVGEIGPSIITALFTGGVGGIVGKVASKGAAAAAETAAKQAATQYGTGRALSGLVASRAQEIAQRSGRPVLDAKVQSLAVQQAYKEVGQLAGFAVGSGIQNIPESFVNIYDETGELRPGAAFVAGSLKSSLDMLTPIMLLRRTQGADVADKVSDAIAAKLLKGRPGASGAVAGAIESFATEGITEGAQTLIDELANTILADKSVDWFKVLESAVKGGVGAAPIGAGAGFVGARQRARREAEAESQLSQRQQDILSARAATEEALTLPEGYAQRKEAGELYDSAHYDRLSTTFERRLKEAENQLRRGKIDPQEVERLRAEVEAHRQLAANAPRERLVAKLAQHYGFNTEQEAALLRASREEFEGFVRETLQDPVAVGRIPELREVEFLTTEPGKEQQLALPAPPQFAYEVPGVGILTPKQADAVIDRWWKRPSLSEDMTQQREEQARQLNQLDPKINEQAGFIDPNERRRLALSIIFGSDNTQIVKAGERFAGPYPTGTDTVPDLVPIDRVSPVGQAGPREKMPTLDNLYTRIVQNTVNAPTKLVDSKWLEEAADLDSIKDEAQREAARRLIRQNAANIFRQLESDQFVQRRGFKFKVKPAGLRLQQLGEAEVERLTNLDTLNQALDRAAQSGQKLGLGWLTKAVQREATPGYPTRILPREAEAIWERLYQKGAVVPDGMYYRAVPRELWEPKKPRKPKTPLVEPLDANVGKPGEVPPNLPNARWNSDRYEVQPNEPVRSDAETEKGIKAGWNKLKSLFGKYMSLRKVLMSESYRTGMEHSTVMDADTGDFIYAHTSNDHNRVSWPAQHIRFLQDPMRNLVLQHSHPNDSALSGADISIPIFRPSFLALVAHGVYGTDSAAFTPPVMRAYIRLRSFGQRQDMGILLRDYADSSYDKAKDFVKQNSRIPLSTNETYLLAVRLSKLAVARTGLMDYADTRSSKDFAAVNNWEKFIEDTYKSSVKSGHLSRIFKDLPPDVNKEREDHGKEYRTRYDRLSVTFGQPGGFETLLGEYTQPSGGATQAATSSAVSQSQEDVGRRGGDFAEEGDAPGGVRSDPVLGRRGFLKGVGKAAAAAKLPGVGLAQKAAKGVVLGRNVKLALKVLDSLSNVEKTLFRVQNIINDARYKRGGDSTPLGRKLARYEEELNNFPSGTYSQNYPLHYLFGEGGKKEMREIAPSLVAQYDAILKADFEIESELSGYRTKLLAAFKEVETLDSRLISRESTSVTSPVVQRFDEMFKLLRGAEMELFSESKNSPYLNTRQTQLYMDHLDGVIGAMHLKDIDAFYNTFMNLVKQHVDPSVGINYENLDKFLEGLNNAGVLDNVDSMRRYLIPRIRDPEEVEFLENNKYALPDILDEARILRNGLQAMKNFSVEKAEAFLKASEKRETEFNSVLDSVLKTMDSNASKMLGQLNSELPKLAARRENLATRARQLAEEIRSRLPDMEEQVKAAVQARRNFGGTWTTMGQEQAWEQLSKFFPEAKESGIVMPTRLPEGVKSPFELMKRKVDDEAAMSEAIPEDYSCR